MRIPFIVLAASFACMPFAGAQTPVPEPLGAVAEVRGLVTMSFGSRVATVQKATPIYEGSRFASSSTGTAELRLENGCTITLQPNEWVLIDSTTSCPRPTPLVSPPNLFVRDALPLLGIAALGGVVRRVQETEITPRPQ